MLNRNKAILAAALAMLCRRRRGGRRDRDHQAVRGRHRRRLLHEAAALGRGQVPETSNPSKQFQMIGIPDGLGAHKGGNDRIVYMNHELRAQHALGAGARRAAEPRPDRLEARCSTGRARSSPASVPTTPSTSTTRSSARRRRTANTTPSFTRFCSGSLAGTERRASTARSTSPTRSRPARRTFDGKGGLTVAIFDNEAHGAPDARPLRLGERARPARHRQVHGDHEHGRRPGEPGPRRRSTASSTCTSA